MTQEIQNIVEEIVFYVFDQENTSLQNKPFYFIPRLSRQFAVDDIFDHF